MRLILINGWSADVKLIDPFIVNFVKNDDVIVLDHLYQYSLNELENKLDGLITEDTVLAGWSLGGMLALNYVASKPPASQPKALILFSTPLVFLEQCGGFSGVSAEDFGKLKAYVDAQDSASLVRVFTHLLSQGSDSYRIDRRYLSESYQSSALPSWSALQQGLHYLATLHLVERLPAVRCPILVVLGAEDVLVSKTSNASLYRGLLNAKVLELDKMGHYPFGKFAESVYEVVKGFLAGVELPSNKMI